MKIVVDFWFDNENVRTAKVIAESEKALIKECKNVNIGMSLKMVSV
ncbi:hypothetical protein RUL31_09615 [Bacillus atrophaeus]|nr:hypothetical protein [Bacillus atrophaeus]WNV81503.1 hypothetical protein RUL31_09615 [Bacillus atrophaeus]